MAAADPRDVRFLRFQDAVVAVLLLTGYVFRADAIVPILAVALAVAAIVGARGNVFFFVFDLLVAPRLAEPTHTEDATATRFSLLVAVAALGTASVLGAVGLGGLGWALALALAISEALAAVAGISLGRALYERIRGRR